MKTVGFASLGRKSVFFLIIFGVAALYVVRLFAMQVVQTEDYSRRASNNSVKTKELRPLRGVFYDRDGELIVENVPAYTVILTPSQFDTANAGLIEARLDLDSGAVARLMKKHERFDYLPRELKRGVPFEVVGWIDEWRDSLPGIDYEIELQRAYRGGVRGSHIFGYLREVSRDRLEADDYYTRGDVAGMSGVEKTYEKYLRGEKGYRFVVVDSKSRPVGRFREGAEDVPSIKGKDLALTIDAETQAAAEKALEGWSGSVVAIEPKTGEVLAMASAPDYDLNRFAYIASKDYLDSLDADPRAPRYNRAIRTGYSPGSTFKILAAIAALDAGAITPTTTFYCPGVFIFGRSFKCHGAHGRVSVVPAIEASCNVFFYNLIFETGVDVYARYANMFGLGRKTGIDLDNESPGLIPTNAYYERRYGKNWPRGNLVSVGIGQGEIMVTPLQLAHLAAMVANDGRSYVPHLVRGYYDEAGAVVPFEFEERVASVKPSTLEYVKEGMYLVVNGARGTARRARIPDIEVAGKTGTAQNNKGEDHAVFMCYAPADDPMIAVGVVVENAGFGGTYAAPIARIVVEAYLRQFPEYENPPEPVYVPPAPKPDANESAPDAQTPPNDAQTPPGDGGEGTDDEN